MPRGQGRLGHGTPWLSYALVVVREFLWTGRARPEAWPRPSRDGASLRQLGERLGWDYSLFGKMEKGKTLGSPEVVQALDTYYGTPGLLLALWEIAAGDHTQFRERYRRYMALESEAVSLWHFAVSVLPGLLQTPAYAREVLAAGGLRGKELDQQGEARMGRRELLDGDDAPPFRTILSEAV